MNDRIKELKQKSYVTKDGEFCFDGGEVQIIDINKFAELLINECADLFTSDPESMTRYTGIACREMIKHYFRVK